MLKGGSSGSKLSDLLRELDCAATASDATALSVVKYASDSADPSGIAAALACMVNNPSNGVPSSAAHSLASAIGGLSIREETNGWNPNALVDAIKAQNPSIDWTKVSEALEGANLNAQDQASFCLLVTALRRAGLQGLSLPMLLYKTWDDSSAQLSLLKQAVAAPPEVFSFGTCRNKTLPLEELADLDARRGSPNEAWLSKDLLTLLARLAVEKPAEVRSILDIGSAAAPEAMLLTFVAAHADWGSLQVEIGDALAAEHIGRTSCSKEFVRRLWKEDSQTVVRAMGLLLFRETSAPVLSRILQLSKDVGSLPEVLHEAPHALAIQLATAASCATASSAQCQLQPWLQKRQADYGIPFLQQLMQFLTEKLNSDCVVTTLDDSTPDLVTVKLPISAVATILGLLLNHLGRMSENAADDLRQLRRQTIAAFPALAEMLPSEEEGTEGGTVPGAGADVHDVDDIETLANDFFQKLYSGEISVTELVATLARFCEGSPRERQVFQCMVHNLFDEYQFFTKYPDKELHTTAHLFGSLVQRKLVTGGPLATALRCIAEAAKAAPGSKLSNFAVEAVSQFRDLLPSLGDFCRTLLKVDHLQQAAPELAAAVSEAAQNDGGRTLTGGAPSFLDNDSIAPSSEIGVSDLLPDGLIAAESHSRGVGEQTVATGAVPLSQARAVAAFDMGMNIAATPFTSGVTAEVPPLPPVGAEAASRSALGLAAGHPAGGSGASASSLGLPSTAPSTVRGLTFATINAETLETAARDADFPVPGQDVIDQVHFVVNNLSTSNLETKSKTLQGVLLLVFWPWFSNYMVVKRAAQEPNFHTLYLALLDKLGEDSGSSLGPTVVATTHKYIRILLASPRIQTHASERSLLKNLGTWLGALTLARNQALRHKDLNVKDSICNAYNQGRMIAVLPFVGKILEATKDSKSYRPSNPWVMAIMSLLAEIYGLDRLKLNLKFEIEMVFRTLGLQISDVKASDLLTNRMRLVGSDNPDFSPDKIAIKVGETAAPGIASTMSRHQPPLPSKAPPMSSIPQETISLPGPGGMDQGLGLCANIGAFVNISPSLGVLAEQLQLKRVVPVAVDRAICEIITPVVERSCTIACKTTRELVAKDFACEPDEAVVREAAHAMVTCLAGSLALVTCKEPLRGALSQHLTQLLQTPSVEPSAVETAVNTCTSDNLDLCCRIIEKAAHDKAIHDIDDRLASTYVARKSAKAAGRPFFDLTVPQTGPGSTAAALPESLRPRYSPLSVQQSRLYADYGRIRTKEPTEGDQEAESQGEGERGGDGSTGPRAHDTSAAQLAAVQLQEMYTSWQRRLEEAVGSEPQAEWRELPQDAPLRTLAGEIVAVVACAPAQNDAAIAVSRKVFSRLLEVGGSRPGAAAYAAALGSIAKLIPGLPSEITALFVATDDKRKYQRAVGEALLREGLLGALQLDAHLASAIVANQGGGGTELAVHLLRAATQESNPPLPASSLAATCQVLGELGVNTSGGAPLLALLAAAAASSAGANSMNSIGDNGGQLGVQAPLSAAGPAMCHLQSLPLRTMSGTSPEATSLREQVALVFDRWAAISHESPGEQSHPAFVAHLHHVGLIQGGEATGKFLKVVVELAVAHCLASPTEPHTVGGVAAPMSFLAVDAAVRLLVLLIREPDAGAPLLSRALGIISEGLQHDSKEGGPTFNPRPYFRLCIGLMGDLLPPTTSADDHSDDDLFAKLNAFAAAFFDMQPLLVAGFAYCWMDLVSHRSFMPALLSQTENRGWGAFEPLLRGMLTFLEPYLRDSQLNVSVRTLYKGVLRVLLVLLHDFPELLCEYHVGLCACVPPSCIQMRNLLLSAFPRAMRLPDPFTLGLKVDLLPEIQQSPRFTATPEALLAGKPTLRKEIDRYITTRAPASWLATLPSLVMLPPEESAAAGTRYDTVLINSLSFYVGVQAMKLQGGEPGAAPPASSPAMDIFGSFASQLDTEGRYLFFNSLANQLRYPNSHTHYFSCTLLFLFAAAQQEVIQEQITRVLLERLIVNRPHPWGLLITFIELIKNPSYSFWAHAFTHCAPEIDRLFESVARSCMHSHDAPPEIAP